MDTQECFEKIIEKFQEEHPGLIDFLRLVEKTVETTTTLTCPPYIIVDATSTLSSDIDWGVPGRAERSF